jgi:photoactive yellow protein
MFQPSSTVTPMSFDPFGVDRKSDSELDLLPFGVIGLDAAGVVLRYNLYESRFARLDRNQVLGRNFFQDVARCTRVDNFEGRFRRYVAEGREGVREQFPFRFDFAFGAQEVGVELVRPPGTKRYYLFINRLSAKLVDQHELSLDDRGIAQVELAPDERALGIRRGLAEERLVEVPWSMLAALRATCDRLAPETWPIFCQEWGVAWGRRMAIELEGAMLESGTSLRELSMRALSERLARELSGRGWGSASFEFAGAGAPGVASQGRSGIELQSHGAFAIHVERSALAEAAGREGKLSCHLVAGCLEAVLGHVAQKRITTLEVACRAEGAPRCSFLVGSRARKHEWEKRIASGARGVGPVLTGVSS